MEYIKMEKIFFLNVTGDIKDVVCSVQNIENFHPVTHFCTNCQFPFSLGFDTISKCPNGCSDKVFPLPLVRRKTEQMISDRQARYYIASLIGVEPEELLCINSRTGHIYVEEDDEIIDKLYERLMVEAKERKGANIPRYIV